MRTDAELRERLAELKRTNVPRCSLSRLSAQDVPGGGGGLDSTWNEYPPVLAVALDAHLRHFAFIEARLADDDENPFLLCPGCMTRGLFRWGLIHGQGCCGCGWPGTMYHFIRDPSPDAACVDCGRPEAQHNMVDWGDGRPPRAHCRRDNDNGSRLYRRPTALRLTMLLWAHPYEVHTHAGGRRRRRAAAGAAA